MRFQPLLLEVVGIPYTDLYRPCHRDDPHACEEDIGQLFHLLKGSPVGLSQLEEQSGEISGGVSPLSPVTLSGIEMANGSPPAFHPILTSESTSPSAALGAPP